MNFRVFLPLLLSLVPFSALSQSYSSHVSRNVDVVIDDQERPVFASRDAAHAFGYDKNGHPFILVNAFRTTEQIVYLPDAIKDLKPLDISSNATVFLADQATCRIFSFNPLSNITKEIVNLGQSQGCEVVKGVTNTVDHLAFSVKFKETDFEKTTLYYRAESTMLTIWDDSEQAALLNFTLNDTNGIPFALKNKSNGVISNLIVNGDATPTPIKLGTKIPRTSVVSDLSIHGHLIMKGATDNSYYLSMKDGKVTKQIPAATKVTNDGIPFASGTIFLTLDKGVAPECLFPKSAKISRIIVLGYDVLGDILGISVSNNKLGQFIYLEPKSENIPQSFCVRSGKLNITLAPGCRSSYDSIDESTLIRNASAITSSSLCTATIGIPGYNPKSGPASLLVTDSVGKRLVKTNSKGVAKLQFSPGKSCALSVATSPAAKNIRPSSARLLCNK